MWPMLIAVALGAPTTPMAPATWRWRSIRGGSDTMNEEAQALLSVVPVFALTDEQGRPVLMRTNDTDISQPQQLFFTEIDVARAHAATIMRMSGDDKLQLKLATLNLAQVWNMAVPDREIRVLADPREVHVARQLLLRAAGYANINEKNPPDKSILLDFSNETTVAEASAPLQARLGFDLEKDVPLFSVAVLNATLAGDKVVQPWFLSFSDLVKAYLNSTTSDDDDYEQRAQAALREMLSFGDTAVTTLTKLVSTVAADADPEVFIMPPSSSIQVLAQAKRQQQQDSAGDIGGDAPPPGGLFDEDGAGEKSGGDLFD